MQVKLIGLAGFFMGLVGMAACGSTPGGNTTGGGEVSGTCVPGSTQACVCAGGIAGAQTCKEDRMGFNPCDCGSTTASSSGSGGASSSSGTGGATGTCGDGVIQASDKCDTPGSEFYCATDCMNQPDAGTGGSMGTGGSGGSCAGHVFYAGKFDGASAYWADLPAAGGMSGLDAGNAQCKALNIGADHVCDYEEVVLAAAANELGSIPQGASAWMQRTTMVDGSPPGPGGRCNNWTYLTNHISDGEYFTFDTAGVPTKHIDNDTSFDPANPHTIGNDLQCGGTKRSLLCCYQSCL